MLILRKTIATKVEKRNKNKIKKYKKQFTNLKNKT